MCQISSQSDELFGDKDSKHVNFFIYIIKIVLVNGKTNDDWFALYIIFYIPSKPTIGHR